MIKVNEIYSFSEIGKRENNEDYVGFEGDNYFVVCDGVGGNEKGEVASAMVGKCFLQEFEKQTDSDASKVLKKAEAELSSYILKHPETQGMATTLTFSQIRNNGIYMAWCGDSRIYQFRDGKIVFQTEDHSWVNEALKSGIITKEEAIGHPKSNIITRAISSTERPTKIDDILIEDVRKSDFIFHCSDGVLEAWNDQDLEALFGQGFTIQEILEKLKSECIKLSRDNATALIYQVEDVNLDVRSVPEIKGTKKIDSGNPIKPTGINIKRKWILITAVFLALAIAILIFKNPKAEEIKEKEKPTKTIGKNPKQQKIKKEIKPNLPDSITKTLPPTQKEMKPKLDSSGKKSVPFQNKSSTTI